MGKIKKKIMPVIAAAALSAAFTSPAYAGTDCGINVEFSTDSHSTAVDGAEFSIAEVLDIDNGVYKWCGNFESAGYTQDAVLSGSEKAAEELASQAGSDTSAKKITGVTKLGRISFTDLDDGVYILYESGKSGDAEEYDDPPAVLVQVPEWEDGKLENTVDVYPKAVKDVEAAKVRKVAAQPQEQEENEDTKTKESGSSEQSENVQTGDENIRGAVLLFGGMAAILLCVGLGMNKQMQKDDQKNREDL